MTLVGGVGDRAVPWPRLTTSEDAGGAGCVFARFLPRAFSVSVDAELEGPVAGTGSASAELGGPGSLMYGAACSYGCS